MQNFQAFTITFSARTNVLFSDAGISQAFSPTPENPNIPQVFNSQAIWDTGATCTVISKKFALEIGLIPTGKTTITGVNHTTEENTYMVNVYLPNKVCITHVKIAEVPALSGNAGLLIGMDIIGTGDFSVYSENGRTIMTYRIPSIGGTDFVKEANMISKSRMKAQQIVAQKQTRVSPDREKLRAKRKKEKLNKKRSKK